MVTQIFIAMTMCAAVVMADWKTDVLNTHNKLRSKIAMGQQPGVPSAKYMARLVWDDELAAEAQAYTDKCIWKHGSEGENLHGLWSVSPSKFPKMVENWFSEVLKAPMITNYDEPDKDQMKGKGHYTQVIWANSKTLGCGYTTGCKTSPTPVIFACRYRPPGNYPVNPIFEAGNPCEKCDGTCTDGLCDGAMKGRACMDTYTACKRDLKPKCNTTEWVFNGCYKTCTEGHCDGAFTTPEPEKCKNKYSNCESYLKPGCRTTEWVFNDCYKTCTEGRCEGEFSHPSTTTTLKPDKCVDKYSNCESYWKSFCKRTEWVFNDCYKTCTEGRCEGEFGATVKPTTKTPEPTTTTLKSEACKDSWSTCANYKSGCGTTEWVFKECYKMCTKGRCQGEFVYTPGGTCFDKFPNCATDLKPFCHLAGYEWVTSGCAKACGSC